MVFHWSLRDSKFPQVSRTLVSILAVHNNPVVWMVTTRPPASESSRPFNNPLVTVAKALITFGIINIFRFHCFFFCFFFFHFLSKFEVLVLLFTFFQFYSVVSSYSKFQNFILFLLLLIAIRSGLLSEIRWSVSMSKYLRSLCVCYFLGQVLGCAYNICP